MNENRFVYTNWKSPALELSCILLLIVGHIVSGLTDQNDNSRRVPYYFPLGNRVENGVEHRVENQVENRIENRIENQVEN